MGKSALSPSSPRAEEQGRGMALTGGGPGPAVWARERLWGEGKGRERPKGSIPPSILGKEACRAGFHGGRRRPWRRCGVAC